MPNEGTKMLFPVEFTACTLSYQCDSNGPHAWLDCSGTCYKQCMNSIVKCHAGRNYNYIQFYANCMLIATYDDLYKQKLKIKSACLHQNFKDRRMRN